MQNFLAHIRTLSDDEEAEADVAEQVTSVYLLYWYKSCTFPLVIRKPGIQHSLKCARQADVAEQVGLSLLALLVQKVQILTQLRS